MKKSLRILVPLLLVAIIIASIGWYLFVYDRDFTRDVLLQQARFHDTQGNTKLASWFYNLAYEHTGQDQNVAIELANQYKADGNYTKAEFTLTNAIADGATVELYVALCKTYVEQDKLLDAVNMLNNVPDPAIRAQLDAMRPAAPAATPEEGFYSQYISVTLTAESGMLYYNVSDEYPSVQDPIFSQPITLEAGETTITAICVADNGLVSPLTTLHYTVGGVIELVEFSDPVVEADLRQLLGKDAEDEIYTNELWTITEYTYPSDAQNFDDLKLLPYLQKLTIHDQQIPSLECLSGLTRLQVLDLTGCRFPNDDLAVLTTLPELQHLTLAECGLSTIADLSGAQHLVTLDLHNNTLRNLEPLSDMTTLEEINLAHNAVTDLDKLSGLSNLQKLDLSFNAVTTLTPLAACTQLSWLDVGNNGLTTLDTVDALNLTYLSVEFNKLTDVSIVANCTSLTALSISNNAITDISMLNNLNSLEIFDFSYNQITSLPQWTEECTLRTIDGSYNQLTTIDSLAILPNLTYVYMDYNSLTNVDALATCLHLVQVNIFGNPVPDVSVLRYTSDGQERGIIVNFDPTVD